MKDKNWMQNATQKEWNSRWNDDYKQDIVIIQEGEWNNTIVIKELKKENKE